MSTVRKYIFVDDDPFNNLISGMAVKRSLGEVDIETFVVPEEALAFIQKEYMKSLRPTILFLDINMETLTGWEFLEFFEKFDDVIKEQITVYVLSSSIDQRDKDKAKANKYVKGFISKPLLVETIISIAGI